MSRPLVDLREQPIIGPSIPARHTGGIVTRPEFIVGERGPERIPVRAFTLRWWAASILKAITNMEASMDALSQAVDRLVGRVKASDDAKDAQIASLTAQVADLTAQLGDVPAQIARLDAVDASFDDAAPVTAPVEAPPA